MKNYKYLFIFLLFIPFIVFAEECNNNITIISMEQIGVEGNAEVINNPIYHDKNIKLDLKMYEVGDSITYNLVIKNDGNEDYMIEEDTFKTDSEYIEYSLSIEDSSNVVKAKSTKNLILKVTYKREVEDNLLTNRMYDASNTLKLSMNTKEESKQLDIITTDNIKNIEEPTKISVTNPLTSSTSLKLISITLLTVIAIIFLTVINKKKYNKYLIILLSFVLIPIVYAVCKCDIKIESKIEIEKRPNTLFSTISKTAIIDNIASTFVTNENGIQFTEISSDTNGKGVYLRAGTENDEYPIYYFRGEVNDNNVIFANYCWQIVRTTKTGGIKLIYNGESSHSKCEKTGRIRVLQTYSPYNEEHKSVADVGYMYGKSYGVFSKSSNELDGKFIKFGKSYTYSNGTYKLVDTSSTSRYWSASYQSFNYFHYTCFNYEGECSNLYYVFRTSSYKAYYIEIENPKTVEDVISEMVINSSNEYSSAAKLFVDDWYRSNLINYTDELEDTIWCNNRTISDLAGWNPTGGDNTKDLTFANNPNDPNLGCINKNDSFTVIETEEGNGDLTYPIGLLTVDEVNLAGGIERSVNTSYYFFDDSNFWTMTPKDFYENSNAVNYFVASETNFYPGCGGSIESYYNSYPPSIARPSISLKVGTTFVSGDGTPGDPYIVQ